jgi:colanic acid/amylovoran biosynthesis glycosyltransferase
MDVIAHLVTPFLFHTGSWVYSQIMGIRGYRSVVLTQKISNADQFPHDSVYSPEQFGFLKKASNQLYRRASGTYGLYFGPAIRSANPRLFHAHMGYEAVRWLSCVARHDRPLITTFYGADVSRLGRKPAWRRRYKKLFGRGDLFLAEGSNLKRQLLDLGCPAEKVVVYHLGVPVAKYPLKTYQPENPRVVLLQVATFREKKGIEYALMAVAAVKERFPEIEFRLIGGGDTARADRAVESLVRRLHLGDRVRLLGVRSHAETLDEMLKADIFLHPSVTAADGDNEGGAPVGIIEASAVGLPVVSTFHADIPEVVKDGITGLLAPERDVDSLVRHISYLLTHRERWGEMGAAGREHVIREYNLDRQIPVLEDIYGSLIGT